MRKAIALVAVLTCAAGAAIAALDEMSFARRVTCEVQEPTGTSLERLTFQQGTTPLVDLYVLRRGRPIATDATVTARLVFGASATAALYGVATNYAATNNSYLVQLPTIGTNSAGAENGLWWYTVYFDRSGKTFWTGNGELVIEKTTSTADGTVWQEITTSAAVAAHNTNTAAHADIRAMTTNATDAVARSHLTESSNTVHGSFIRTAYDWATNAYAYAGLAWIQATNALHVAQTEGLFAAWLGTNTYVKVEADTVWGVVSNTVTTNAAAGQAHAATAHAVTAQTGFRGGANANAEMGGSVGRDSSSVDGGSVGFAAISVYGGTVGYEASSGDGGSVGMQTKTTDGFAGGKQAMATTDGTLSGTGIDAIQLGTGGNTNPLSLQIYSYPLMLPDGTIPLARTPSLLATNGNGAGLTGITAAQVGAVPTNRTITVNGQVAALDSNVTFNTTLQQVLDQGNTATNDMTVGTVLSTNVIASQGIAINTTPESGKVKIQKDGGILTLESGDGSCGSLISCSTGPLFLGSRKGGGTDDGKFGYYLHPWDHAFTCANYGDSKFTYYGRHGAVAFRSFSDGRFSINTNAAAAILDVNGDAIIRSNLTAMGSITSSNRFYFGNGASLYASGSNLYFVVPDGSVTNPLTSNP